MEERIYRSTTPTIILNIKNEDFDLSLINICHVTLESESGQTSLRKTAPEIDVENKKISITLTQEETAKFSTGIVNVQLKIKLNNGTVIPSKIVKIDMKKILEEEFL